MRYTAYYYVICNIYCLLSIVIINYGIDRRALKLYFKL